MQSIPKYTPDCKEVTENKCHNFTIPEFQVRQRQESQTISVSLPRCQPTVEMAEFCTNLPMGNPFDAIIIAEEIGHYNRLI